MSQYGAPANAGEESTTIKVGIADSAVTTNGCRLRTSGLGSCLGIVLYDEKTGVAGLVHVMLPEGDETGEKEPAKFVDTGIESLLADMQAKGATPSNIVAKVAGGSDMLDLSDETGNIGSRNVEKAKEVLGEYGIRIENADTGGEHGRSLELDTTTGQLEVSRAGGDSVVL
ncbi:MAG: chemotaxis protein CheD [Halobacteriales archaeon]